MSALERLADRLRGKAPPGARRSGRMAVRLTAWYADTMETLGEFIRRRRSTINISLRELARRIECTPAFVSDVELGRRNPSDTVLTRIGKALSTEMDELRQRDTRAPIEAIKLATQADPRFAIAFRTILDKRIPPDDLFKWAKRYKCSSSS